MILVLSDVLLKARCNSLKKSINNRNLIKFNYILQDTLNNIYNYEYNRVSKFNLETIKKNLEFIDLLINFELFDEIIINLDNCIKLLDSNLSEIHKCYNFLTRIINKSKNKELIYIINETLEKISEIKKF